MTAERRTSALVGSRQLTSDAVRQQQFPTQLLGGCSPDAVHNFLAKVAREFDRLHEQLEHESAYRARAEAEAREAVQDGTPVRLLYAAQQSADKAVADAQHQADTMLEHARQQADRILAEARQRAGIDGRQLIAEATAESRRQVAHYLQLAHKIQVGLHRGAATLQELLGEWAQEAGPEVTNVLHPQAPPAAEEPAPETPAEPAAEEAAPAAPRKTARTRAQNQAPAAG
jgi:DivIVA domain-containing protein